MPKSESHCLLLHVLLTVAQQLTPKLSLVPIMSQRRFERLFKESKYKEEKLTKYIDRHQEEMKKYLEEKRGDDLRDLLDAVPKQLRSKLLVLMDPGSAGTILRRMHW